MISADQRFYIFILASFLAFFLILRFVTRQRSQKPFALVALGVAAIVVVGGMLFAKFAQNAGWPWWIYYTVPAFVTLALPPIAFRFSARELWQYLGLAFLSSPAVHVIFSFFLGWHEYMPFIPVPSLQDMLNHGVGA